METNQKKAKVRLMTKEDCKSVAKIEKMSFSCPWSEQSFLETLEKKDCFYLVVEQENENREKELIGYVGIWQSFEEADITNVAVLPKERRKGIGLLLLQEAITEALHRGITALTLEVRVSNLAAVRLYQRSGFVSEGVRPGYYKKPKEDALIMWNRSLRGITIENQKNYPV